MDSYEIDLGFMSRSLAQISLPHSDIKTNYFERTNGVMTLSIMSNPKVGLPYGTYPRLLLAWLCTEAVKTQNPVLHLGSNQTEFLKKLQLDNCGSYITPLKEQTNRLLSSVFRIDFKDKNLKGFKHLLLADSGFEFWEPQTGEWEAHINLTSDFFSEVVQHPVPLDLNVLQALRKSPLAMDVYTWLAYRSYSIYISGNRPVKISWADLKAQFGSNYGSQLELFDMDSDLRMKKEQQGLLDFKKRFIASLQKIQQYYPDLEQLINTDSQFLTLGGAKLIG